MPGTSPKIYHKNFMLMPLQEQSDLGSCFPVTQWTALLRPIREHGPEAEAALEKLCRVYWKPLYEYARRRGVDHHAAEEVTHEFIGCANVTSRSCANWWGKR